MRDLNVNHWQKGNLHTKDQSNEKIHCGLAFECTDLLYLNFLLVRMPFHQLSYYLS